MAFEKFQNGMLDEDDLSLAMNSLKSWIRFEAGRI